MLKLKLNFLGLFFLGLIMVAGVKLFAVAFCCAQALGACSQDSLQDGRGKVFP